MKKLFLALLMCLFAFNAHAGNVAQVEIMDTDFNAVTTADYSDEMPISGYRSVAFFVVYDETEVGNAISAAITCDVSYDGTNWLTGMSFYDIAGGATAQTSETISSDGWYVFWVNNLACVPYIRIKTTLTNTDADDLATVKVYMSARE
jgi:hypothetical protein